MFRIIVATLISFWVVLNGVAQEDSPFPIGDVWTYQSACLIDGVELSDHNDWAGTIIMSGYYGYHGYNADWETPRVMSFNRSRPAREFISRSFSFDWNWAVEVYGNRACSRDLSNSCTNTNNQATTLRIRSISATNPHATIDIPSNYLTRAHHTGYDDILPTWLDNYHVVYSSGPPYEVIDVRDGSVEMSNDLPHRLMQPTRLSPNRLYYTAWQRDEITDIGYPVLIDVQTEKVVDRVEAFDNLEWIPETSYGLWSPDSNYLLVLQRLDDDRNLYLYDRSTNTLTYVLNAHRLGFGGFLDYLSWSPNSNYLLLNPYLNTEAQSLSLGFHLIDVNHHRIIDICWNGWDGIAWSPDGNHLARIQNDQLTILNLESLEWRIATTPILSNYRIVGWQAD